MPERSSDYTTAIDQRSDYIRFLKTQADSRLSFQSHLETEFSEYRNHHFLQQEKNLLILGILLYLFFIWSDLIPLPSEYGVWLATARATIAVMMATSLYIALSTGKLIFIKYSMPITSFFLVLAGIHVCIGAIFLPHPDDYIYLIGLIPITLGVIALLRYHFVLCCITLCANITSCSVILLLVPENRELVTHITSIDLFLDKFALIFLFFLISISLTGAYLTFSFEKMMRNNWIKQRVSQLEAENMQDLTSRLRDLTRQDELTQIANRRHFHEELIAEINRSQRDEMALSVIMLDIDHFKPYNDHYGHQAGDLCLQKVANCMSSQCHRKDDLVARYGGEEFIILLPHTDEEGAAFMADSIRLAVELLKIPHEHSPFGYISVSIGVTTVIPNDNMSTTHIIRQADEALYKAKNSGRNQYKTYADTLPNA